MEILVDGVSERGTVRNTPPFAVFLRSAWARLGPALKVECVCAAVAIPSALEAILESSSSLDLRLLEETSLKKPVEITEGWVSVPRGVKPDEDDCLLLVFLDRVPLLKSGAGEELSTISMGIRFR